MTAVEDQLELHFSALSKDNSRPLFYLSLLPTPSSPSSASPPSDAIPIDTQIQAVTERLRKLKRQQHALRTKELFLQRLRAAKPLDQLFPTAQDVARMDVTLNAEKTKLRAVKKQRAALEAALGAAGTQLASAAAARAQKRSDVAAQLRTARAAARLADVQRALRDGGAAAAEALVRGADGLEAGACEAVLGALRARRAACEREAGAGTGREEQLRAEVAELQEDVDGLQRAADEVRAEIARNDEENAAGARMREECLALERLGGVLAALGGVRVLEVRESGMTFGLDARVFGGRGGERRRQEGQVTHELEVEVGNGDMCETVVAFMHLSPADVDVSDMREELGVTVERGVREVCSRLAVWQTKQSGRGSGGTPE